MNYVTTTVHLGKNEAINVFRLPWFIVQNSGYKPGLLIIESLDIGVYLLFVNCCLVLDNKKPGQKPGSQNQIYVHFFIQQKPQTSPLPQLLYEVLLWPCNFRVL